MRELTPIISVDDRVLTEHKDFTLSKLQDGSISIRLHDRHLTIDIAANASSILLAGKKNDWPRFYFNGNPVIPLNVFSHMQGNFPGVTIRFIGQQIRMLQLIPRLMDKNEERQLEKKEYERQHPHAF